MHVFRYSSQLSTELADLKLVAATWKSCPFAKPDDNITQFLTSVDGVKSRWNSHMKTISLAIANGVAPPAKEEMYDDLSLVCATLSQNLYLSLLLYPPLRNSCLVGIS